MEKNVRGKKNEGKTMLILVSWNSIGPLFLVFLFIMDQVFVINTVIFDPVGALFMCCGVECVK